MKARGRTRYLTSDEEARLLAALPEGVKRDAATFLLDTGARVNEALTLTWDDLAHYPALDRVTFWRTKTRRVRTLPLTERAADCLRRSRAEGRCRPFPVAYHAFWVAYTKAKLAAGFGADVVVHTTRHTFASRLVQSGMHIAKVQLALGHSNIAETMRYSHLDPTALDDVPMRLGRYATA